MGYIQDSRLGVHEVDFGGGPVSVYFREMNLEEMGKIQAASRNTEAELMVECVFWRARDERGVRMFRTEADKDDIRTKFRPAAVVELVSAMNEYDAAGNP